MTKIEELRNHIMNTTCSGDLPDTTLATFDDMVEAVELLQRVYKNPDNILQEEGELYQMMEKLR